MNPEAISFFVVYGLMVVVFALIKKCERDVNNYKSMTKKSNRRMW